MKVVWIAVMAVSAFLVQVGAAGAGSSAPVMPPENWTVSEVDGHVRVSFQVNSARPGWYVEDIEVASAPNVASKNADGTWPDVQKFEDSINVIAHVERSNQRPRLSGRLLACCEIVTARINVCDDGNWVKLVMRQSVNGRVVKTSRKRIYTGGECTGRFDWNVKASLKPGNWRAAMWVVDSAGAASLRTLRLT